MFSVGFEKTAAASPNLLKNLAESAAARGASKFNAKTFMGAAKMSKPQTVAGVASSVRNAAAGTPGAVQAGFKAQRIERGAANAAAKAKVSPISAGPQPIKPVAASTIGGAAKPAGEAAAKPAGDISQHLETAKNWIRANPLKSTAIGAGAGVMAGKALGGSQQQQQYR